MTSQSRGRDTTPVPGPDGINSFVKDVLSDFAALAADPDLLRVEVLASEVAGAWWEDPEGEDVARELIDRARKKATPGAAALLTSLSVLAPDPGVREAAAVGLRAVLGRGIPEPEWAAGLGAVGIDECWQLGDVYGDTASLLAVLHRDQDRIGIFALLHLSDGSLPDVTIVDNPDDLLAGMRGQAEENEGLLLVERIEPARLRGLLERGIAVIDTLEEPEVTEEFIRFRALALAYCRVLPDAEPPPAAEPLGDWETVVEEFLSANPGLPDTDDTRYCVRLLIDFGVQTEPSRPLRISPERMVTFLEDWLPGEIELSETEQEVLPDVVLAWTRWAALRQGLPELALAELDETVQESLASFGEDSLEVYLDGDEELEGPVELTELLERRMFAVPTTVTELGDTQLELEPTDPEQRRLLVIGEHPEYHEALTEDSDIEEIDGVDPREYLALKAAVVDQLWENEPPQLWSAVVRMRDTGRERDDILDELVAVLSAQAETASEPDAEEFEFDLDAYCEALEALG
ncbi:hypothetical protein [Amycolatopsis palatopharyngis]|uniref:hypothetical protein n=1 Tax=Amycolatopsis palatopharyngis TaxID=187982 RepID=UPI001FE3647F|nr:hypothetical protein [Amycolatopsis palatopharyngis]